MASHLHFVQSLEPLEGGGLGRAALDLHLEFLRRGVPSHLVATCAGSFQEAWLETTQLLRMPPARAFYSLGLGRLSGALAARADIVHGHGLYVATNWLLGREARRQRKPLVLHVHGFFEPWILARSRWKKRLAHFWFENENFRHARLWRALTLKEADQIRAQVASANIVVAPNGVDVTFFKPDGAQNTKTAPRQVLFLGRLHPKKGLDLLLPAWAAAGPARRGWELLIAGPDEQGYLATVEKLIAQLRLNGSVRLTGPVTGSDKLALLQSASLFALTSQSEGFSVAILEAMACGLPVLATTACNFAELATEGGGWECQPTVDSVTQALCQALPASGVELEQRGAAARRLVETKYTWPRVSGLILEGCRQYCS
jgi:glycosyltransferase involved in cell wall biosynthesis